MRRKREKGQATLLVLLASSIFVIGALGLAIDGAQLYAHRQMAQAAADAAAQAGIMTYFDRTYSPTNSPPPWPLPPPSPSPLTLNYPCTTSDQKTACQYAASNGFGTTSDDTVTLDFGNSTSPYKPAGVALSSDDAVSWMTVTVTRKVHTSLIQLVGAANFMIVKAKGTAAIVSELSPIPILVLHPSLAGAFSKNGSNQVIICGGPSRSIQVDSSDSGAVSVSGNSGAINLDHAGPLDLGNCVDGSGADFGNVGGPISTPTGLSLGALPGTYIQNASRIEDPLLGLPAPPVTIKNTPIYGGYLPAIGGSAAANLYGCPSTLPNSVECRLYSPGYYAGGISLGGSGKAFAIFRPGIYYINHGGFQLGSNSIARMAVSPPYDLDPSTGTGWTKGMLIYNSPSTPVDASNDVLSFAANAGQINNVVYPDASQCGTDSAGAALGGNCLVGANGGALTSGLCSSSALLNSSYYGLLFFQDRSVATSLSHSINGGGGLTLKGTIYATHTLAGIVADGTYQSFSLQGNGGSTTTLQGQIMVDSLSLGGTSNIAMNLSGLSCYTVRHIALVK